MTATRKLAQRIILVLGVIILAASPVHAAGEAPEEVLKTREETSVLQAPHQAPGDDFMITVKTDNVSGGSGDNQFIIPTSSGETYNYNVDCDNDGTNEAVGQTGDYTCTYAEAGTYTIRIKDNVGDGTGFPRVFFHNGGDVLKLLSVDQWGRGKWTSMASAFYGCENMTLTATDAPDLSQVRDMSWMFSEASAFNGEIGEWDVSQVTDMSYMFNRATAFDQGIGGWDVSQVTDMSYMFSRATAFDQGIGGWDVSNVGDMSHMFMYAEAFTQDIGEWDVSNVDDMSYMFAGASAFNQDIGDWDVGNVTNMIGMFMHAELFNQDLSSWDVSLVGDMGDMFDNTALSIPNYDAILNAWQAQEVQPDVSFGAMQVNYCKGEAARTALIDEHGWTITDNGKDCAVYDDFVITVKTDNAGSSADNAFIIPTYSGESYNYNVDCDNDGIDDAVGQTDDYLCAYAYDEPGTYTIRIKDNVGDGSGFPRIYFNSRRDHLKLLSVDQWGTGQWTSMANAFYGCENMTLTATDSPDLSQVADMSYMFAGASAFNGEIGDWDVSNVTNMQSVFADAVAFNGDIGDWDVSSVDDMSHMFADASAFNQNIGGWDVSSVDDMSHMFADASAFNQNIGGWDVSSVDNMSYMFANASAFTQDIGNWDVSNVIYMDGMFADADAFNQDIGDWDTGNVMDMTEMFYGADAFNQDIGGWDVSNVTDMTDMFHHTALSTTNYDALLIGWNAQDLKPNVPFDAGNSNYCEGEAARANMIAADGWTITDGGKACSFNGSAEIIADQPIVAISRPHIGSEIMAYNGFNSGDTKVFLPMLFNGIWGYTASFTVENTGNTSATFDITFKDASDGTVTCVLQNQTLPLHQAKTYDVSQIGICDMGSLPTGWVGGATIESDEPIVAVAKPNIDGYDAITYNGFTSGADTAYLPMLFRGMWGYQAAFYVQNLDTAQDANLTIEFYGSDGTHTCTYVDPTPITPDATRGYWMSSIQNTDGQCEGGTGFGENGWVGSAVITSTGSSQIVAIGRPHMEKEVAAYNGFTQGSTTNYLPMLFRNIWGYQAAFYIQNISGNQLPGIQIDFYNADGSYTCTYNDTTPLANKATRGYWLPSIECNDGGSFPANGWAGSAKIITSEEVIAVGRPHLSDKQVAAYNAFTAGETHAYVPFMFRNYNGNQTALYIQNLGAGDAETQITFYDEETGQYCNMTLSIPPDSSGAIWLASLTDDVCLP